MKNKETFGENIDAVVKVCAEVSDDIPAKIYYSLFGFFRELLGLFSEDGILVTNSTLFTCYFVESIGYAELIVFVCSSFCFYFNKIKY